MPPIEGCYQVGKTTRKTYTPLRYQLGPFCMIIQNGPRWLVCSLYKISLLFDDSRDALKVPAPHR
jgi:hypothetical protein